MNPHFVRHRPALPTADFYVRHDSPAQAQKCPACGFPFFLGERGTYIPLGPGADEDERRKAREGKACSAVAVPVHYACATGHET